MTLTPAYGRDYTSGKAARADFEAGKDFVLNQFGHPDDGRLCNKEQIPAGTFVQLRFKKNAGLCAFKVGTTAATK